MVNILAYIAISLFLVSPFVMYLLWPKYYDRKALRYGHNTKEHKRSIKIYSSVMIVLLFMMVGIVLATHLSSP